MLSKSAGEILRMTHVARGLDSDGALLLDVAVSGHALQLPSAADVNVKVKPREIPPSSMCTSALSCIEAVETKS